MGRMLETLTQGEGRRVLPTIAKPAVDTAVQDCVVDWEIGAEVPFVEVGGPNRKVELSPGLLSHPAQIVPQPPHHAVATAPAAVKPKALLLTPTQPMFVAYETWPDPTPAPTGISAEIIAYHQPDHAASKEYAGLLETMLQGVKGTGPNVLMLIGMKPHVGASTVLLNLAAIAAQQKKLRVALVEASGPAGDLALRLGHAIHAGLGDVIAGTLSLEQAIIRTAIAPLHLLPAGNKPTLITSEALTWLIIWLRARYDLILIDGPTLEESAALAVHVPHAHGIYLVLPQGDSAAGKSMAQSISRMGGHMCGLIHTHFER